MRRGRQRPLDRVDEIRRFDGDVEQRLELSPDPAGQRSRYLISIDRSSHDEYLRLKPTPDVACLYLSVCALCFETVRTENEIQEVKPERKQE